MNKAALFLGQPIQFKNLCKIYPPTVNDVVTNPLYHQLRQTLTISQEDIWDMMKKQEDQQQKSTEGFPTPYEMLLINSYHSKELEHITIKAFEFFTHEEVRILPDPKMILFIDHLEEVQTVEDLRILQEEDFFEFQNIIRFVCATDIIEPPVEDEDPRVARIKAKARERERIKQTKGTKGSIELVYSLGALCCMGIGITPLNIGEISYASAMLLTQTYQEQEKYRADIQLLAGGNADPKKIKPKYWIRNLDN